MGLGMAKASSNMETDDYQSPYRPPTPPSQPAAMQASTGEEAYLRRLQMSRGFVKQPSPPEAPPSFIDSSHSTPEQPQPISPLPQPTFVPPLHPEREERPAPPPEEENSNNLTSFTAVPTTSSASLTQDVIDERRKQAAAIAARLSALSKLQAPPVTQTLAPPQTEMGNPNTQGLGWVIFCLELKLCLMHRFTDNKLHR
jgi:splicing factor 45